MNIGGSPTSDWHPKQGRGCRGEIDKLLKKMGKAGDKHWPSGRLGWKVDSGFYFLKIVIYRAGCRNLALANNCGHTTWS